ncbi:MAG: zinc ribbon domain-containing protein [Acidobacteriaceae bacterium]|nr:zinc ribbon domain-containing protein [Acidobacteriaceae bacterium]
MPIFEYACDDCGTKFEKLVRRSAEAETLRCPTCGQDHLTTQYSTFAAHSGSASSHSEAPAACGEGMCGSGFCGSGMCGMN